MKKLKLCAEQPSVDTLVEAVLSLKKSSAYKQVQDIPVSDHVIEYAVHLVRQTRPPESSAPDYVKEYVGWGADFERVSI